MKKKVFGRKLSRASSTRKALFRSIIRALVLYGSIKTTKAKAKAVQAEVEKMINLAKEGSLSKRRQVYGALGNDRNTSEILFNTVVPTLTKKKSGFTRIINLPQRRGDRSQLVKFEWTSEISKVSVDKNKKGEKPHKVRKNTGLKSGKKLKIPKKVEDKKDTK